MLCPTCGQKIECACSCAAKLDSAVESLERIEGLLKRVVASLDEMVTKLRYGAN